MARAAFGGYQIVDRIGRGAAGTVFAAEHGQLRHQVAIKVLHPHLVGDPWQERMRAEADVLSRLDHPGVVKVFDTGVAADGRTYVVMERLVGEPLHVRLRRAALSEERVATFGRQLASALDAAHRAGVVHRDLKPENVFIVRDPELPGGERVKLLDFGIAKREGTEQTATGVVLGTPAYMAPEQFLDPRHVDPRADIYSLGVVLYMMATGEPPFTGRDTGELLAEHAFCRPVPASQLGPVSRRLSAIIERCLAKRPDDRFGTMAELGAALGELDVASAASAASAALDDVNTLVLATLDDATTDLVLPETLGSAPVSYQIGTSVLPLVHAPAPPPPARPARRSARWLLAPIAAGAVLALLYGVYSDDAAPPIAAATAAGSAPAAGSAATGSAPAATGSATAAPRELPVVAPVLRAPPLSPAELGAAEAGDPLARSITEALRDATAVAVEPAAAPGASAPARPPRPRVKALTRSRKPAKEDSYADVAPPTLF